MLGVTTAATLWVVTVIGLCFGGGQLGLGLAATGVTLLTLWPLRVVEHRLRLGHRGSLLVETLAEGPDAEAVLRLLRERGFQLRARRVAVEPQSQRLLMQCSGQYRADHPGWSQRLVAEMAQRPGVTRVEWQDAD